jgi:hypothetical protein
MMIDIQQLVIPIIDNLFILTQKVTLQNYIYLLKVFKLLPIFKSNYFLNKKKVVMKMRMTLKINSNVELDNFRQV